MQIRCPHCAKLITMTPEELASEGGRVVCPKCLTEFNPGVDLTGVKPSHAQQARPARQQQPQAVVQFCPSCGKRLPAAGLNFCPFCGSTLTFGQAPAPAESPAPAAYAQPRQPSASAFASAPAVSSEPEGPTIGSAPYVKQYKYLPELKSRELRQQPASLLTQVVCWVIILLLAALFVWIVWMGSKP